MKKLIDIIFDILVMILGINELKETTLNDNIMRQQLRVIYSFK